VFQVTLRETRHDVLRRWLDPFALDLLDREPRDRGREIDDSLLPKA
jgi:hypothetical protein